MISRTPSTHLLTNGSNVLAHSSASLSNQYSDARQVSTTLRRYDRDFSNSVSSTLKRSYGDINTRGPVSLAAVRSYEDRRQQPQLPTVLPAGAPHDFRPVPAAQTPEHPPSRLPHPQSEAVPPVPRQGWQQQDVLSRHIEAHPPPLTPHEPRPQDAWSRREQPTQPSPFPKQLEYSLFKKLHEPILRLPQVKADYLQSEYRTVYAKRLESAGRQHRDYLEQLKHKYQFRWNDNILTDNGRILSAMHLDEEDIYDDKLEHMVGQYEQLKNSRLAKH